MSVCYSNQVKVGLREYKKSLRTYPISKERAVYKTNAMKTALANVGINPTIHPICNSQDLGQIII